MTTETNNSVVLDQDRKDQIKNEILRLIPNGDSIGNGKCRSMFSFPVTADEYDAVKNEMMTTGVIAQGRGRGGSIYLAGTTPPRKSTTEPKERKPRKTKDATVTLTSEQASEVVDAIETAASEEQSVPETVIVPLANKPWENCSSWLLEVLSICKAAGHPVTMDAAVIARATDGHATTDDVNLTMETVNLALQGTGTYIHYSKGLVQEV